MPKFLPRIVTLGLTRALIALVVVMAGGIVGYTLIENWSILDAAYMVVLTLTTVGFAEVHPLSENGRLFTMALMVVGIGVMFYILTSMVQLVVEQEVLRTLVRRHRMRTQLAKLEGHFIVCGFGRVGSAAATAIQEESIPLVVIDKDEDALSEADDHGFLNVKGDSTKDEDLLAINVKHARGLIAATGDDSENVYISLTARGLNPNLHIVARASRADSVDKLRRAGSNEVVSPYIIGGRHMAMSAIGPNPTIQA